MKHSSKYLLNRRNFLRQALCSTAGITGMSSVGGSLALANAALAQSSTRFDDYRALVCIFLFGGNDSLNMLVPTDNTEYQIYQNVRQNLAFAQDSLLPINPLNGVDYNLGLPSAMSSVQSLFGSGRLSFVSNVGPLLAPVTKQELMTNIGLAPPQLFSHNDQQDNWHTSRPDVPAVTGWAGRMADLIAEQSSSLPLNLSINGNNLMQTGASTALFSLSSQGPEQFAALDPQQPFNDGRNAVFEQLLAESSSVLERGYSQIINRAMSNNILVRDVLESSVQSNTVYPAGNRLADQLEIVARLISVEQLLGQPRQVYFVGLGGWDTHDQQATLHPQLLTTLSEALAAFQQNIEQLGMSDAVTTFTMSDFGRTLTSNGDGTDHGWGGHQLVMGGAVQGGQVLGRLPALELNSGDDLDDGRIIPTTSVDQYIASLAAWFGLTVNELNAVLPNLNRFDADSLAIFS
jgi:uncharacterized protein (DUF1501 family)